MIEEYLIKIITECYNHKDNERFEEFKCGLSKFASSINNCIGNSCFSFRCEGNVIKGYFIGNLILEDLKFNRIIFSKTNYRMSLSNADTFVKSLYISTDSIDENQRKLSVILGNYIIQNYPDFANKVIILS